MEIDVVIAGAGPAGLLMAKALGTLDLRVLVVDPAFELHQKDSPRAIGLHHTSQLVIKQFGAWAHLDSKAEPVRQFVVCDQSSSKTVIYSDRDLNVSPLSYGIVHKDLRQGLLKSVLDQPSVNLHPARISACQRKLDHLAVQLDDGATVKTKLLIGADGRKSFVRTLCGIGTRKLDYDQVATCFQFTHQKSHMNRVVEILTPGGPKALLPIRSGLSSMTWVDKKDSPATHFQERLNELFAPYVGACEIVTECESFPLGAMHSERYATLRTALIGDAAHGVHPIHAQGFNMAVFDVHALFSVLEAALRSGHDLGGACLRNYERLRLSDNQLRLMLTDGLNRIFSSDNSLFRELRGTMLSGLANFRPLRQRAIAYGMRLNG